MGSFRTRLTLILIAMIGLSVLAAGLFMGKTFKDNHMEALQENMEREMEYHFGSNGVADWGA